MHDLTTDFQALELKLAYHFSNAELLRQALTHRSLALVDAAGNAYHNQRLEFLGDAILGAVIAEAVTEHFSQDDEGVLSRKLVALVNGQTLTQVARELTLGAYLHLSESEEKQGGRNLPSNLEDACEAVIGAIFLDGGFDAARTFVRAHWQGHMERLSELRKDPKTALQEWLQAKSLPLPVYEVTATSGPAHAPEFTVRVTAGKWHADASGANKKFAEREAAARLLEKLL